MTCSPEELAEGYLNGTLAIEFERPLPAKHEARGRSAAFLAPLVALAGVFLSMATLGNGQVLVQELCAALPGAGGRKAVAIAIGAVMGTSVLGPLVMVGLYVRWQRQRFGVCQFQSGAGVFSSPYLGTQAISPSDCGRRRRTRFGLQVWHPRRSRWLLIPCSGLEAAGEVARFLDDLGSPGALVALEVPSGGRVVTLAETARSS